MGETRSTFENWVKRKREKHRGTYTNFCVDNCTSSRLSPQTGSSTATTPSVTKCPSVYAFRANPSDDGTSLPFPSYLVPPLLSPIIPSLPLPFLPALPLNSSSEAFCSLRCPDPEYLISEIEEMATIRVTLGSITFILCSFTVFSCIQ